MKPPRSHGRQSVRATLKPRELMQPKPEYNDVWQAHIVTLFPELFPGVLGASLTGKALQDGIWQLHTHDLRPYGIGKHRTEWTKEEYGSSYYMLESLKKVFDPKGIMNKGTIFPLE